MRRREDASVQRIRVQPGLRSTSPAWWGLRRTARAGWRRGESSLAVWENRTAHHASRAGEGLHWALAEEIAVWLPPRMTHIQPLQRPLEHVLREAVVPPALVEELGDGEVASVPQAIQSVSAGAAGGVAPGSLRLGSTQPVCRLASGTDAAGRECGTGRVIRHAHGRWRGSHWRRLDPSPALMRCQVLLFLLVVAMRMPPTVAGGRDTHGTLVIDEEEDL
eukprot:scaffold6726_cov89-Isochrysis_galbana.AAC.4